MLFNDVYRRQVEFLVRTLPYVAEEECFALKGGTAINLFVRDMPRLSVDIDLTYLPIADRDQSLAAIIYLLSHDHSPHTLLSPATRDIKHDYEQNFLGMTEEDIAMETLLATRTALVGNITANMPEKHRRFLFSFYRRQPEWSLLEMDGLDQLPAVRWRELNLDKAGKDTRVNIVRRLEEVLKLKKS